MRLDPTTLSSMMQMKSFDGNGGPINGMSFSADGQSVITSSDDDLITLYNVNMGTKGRSVSSFPIFVLYIFCMCRKFLEYPALSR